MPKLSEIRGQERALTIIRRAFDSGRLAHAYLFIGHEGSGKASCAWAMAAALNCLNNPGEGCEECPSCLKMRQGVHPDVHLLGTRSSHLLQAQAAALRQRGVESAAEPTNATILIEQIRELESRLDLAPHEGRYRVVIIDGADLLNDYSSNALLKSLEEPRPQTVFILVSSVGHRLLPTIISRCQALRFAPLMPQDLRQIASRLVEATEAELQTASELAEGSAKRMIELLEGQRIASLQKISETILRLSERPSAVEMFSLSTAFSSKDDRAELMDMLHLIRLQLRAQLLATEGLRPAMRRLRAVEEAAAALRGNGPLALVIENLILGMSQAVI